MKDVGRNVYLIPIVLQTKLASGINVRIRALELAVKTPNAKLSIIYLLVLV